MTKTFSNVMVYPRVCGGTHGIPEWAGMIQGLSPRVRGNHEVIPTGESRPRSIPACAGEPTGALIVCAAQTVYPRVCGGTMGGPACVAAA